MPDWTRSMKQTYEFYIVDPTTWKDVSAVNSITKCTITRDKDDETLGSASISCTEDLTDKYVRVYLITVQDEVRDRHSLGTHIYQTPTIDFNGKYQTTDQDGYTPLIELKEKPPQIGYALRAGTPIMAMAKTLIEENARAPVVGTEDSGTLSDDFVSETDDNWLYFTSDLVACAGYSLGLDEIGQIIFEPDIEVTSMTPIWEFNDDNSSILYPEVSLERDLFNVPNVIEVVYSPPDGDPIYSVVENNDPNSVLSTVSRGRRIVYRETDPDVVDNVTKAQLDEYALKTLKDLSSIEYTLSYKHGYCPVRLGDCVLLNYKAAGLVNVKAKVTRQVINCVSGCAVEETAVYTKSLWEGEVK